MKLFQFFPFLLTLVQANCYSEEVRAKTYKGADGKTYFCSEVDFCSFCFDAPDACSRRLYADDDDANALAQKPFEKAMLAKKRLPELC